MPAAGTRPLTPLYPLTLMTLTNFAPELSHVSTSEPWLSAFVMRAGRGFMLLVPPLCLVLFLL